MGVEGVYSSGVRTWVRIRVEELERIGYKPRLGQGKKLEYNQQYDHFINLNNLAQFDIEREIAWHSVWES